MRRSVSSEPAGVLSPAALGSSVLSVCPLLVEHLTCCRWEDGEVRETSTVTIVVDDGVLKACLNDRSERRSLWVTSTTVEGLIGALENVLGEGNVGWRAWGPDNRKKKGKN